MPAMKPACVICGSREGLRPVLALDIRTLLPLAPERQELDAAGERMWLCSSPLRECIHRGELRQRRRAEVAEVKRGPRRDRGEKRGRKRSRAEEPTPAGKCATCEGHGHPLRVRSRGGSGKATYSRIACAACGGTGLAPRARP